LCHLSESQCGCGAELSALLSFPPSFVESLALIV
jgi:hypothetical protein